MVQKYLGIKCSEQAEVAEHNVHQVVVIKEVDFVSQEVINNSFVQGAAVVHNVHQVVVIKGADSAKQDNKHQNIPKNIYLFITTTLTTTKLKIIQLIINH